MLNAFVALKCDLRDDQETTTRLQRYGMHTVQYEEGLTVARRIRASRYLGSSLFFRSPVISLETG